MPERMDRDKMNRILSVVESIKTESTDKQILNMCQIVEKCIDIVDDLQEDVLFYEDELERLRFEKEDRRLERSGINASGRRNGRVRQAQEEGRRTADIADMLGI